INLPAAATCTGRIYVICRMYSANAYGGVTVKPNGSEQIMGKNGIILWDMPPLTIQSTGIDWIATYGSTSYSTF
ncbi:MAG TPA: hypothetical protein VJ720_03130, partial [Chitinophaga sp.]|nr:hypothetical protein [Chitinophaga sp.]